MRENLKTDPNLIRKAEEIIFNSFLMYLLINLGVTYSIVLTRTPAHMRNRALISATIFLCIPIALFLIIKYIITSYKLKIVLYSITMVLFYIVTVIFYFNELTNYTNILLAINLMILLSVTARKSWVYGFAGLTCAILILSILKKEDDIIYYTSIGVLITSTYACTLIIKRFKEYIENLSQLNASLESKVIERTASLVESNEELRALYEDLQDTQKKLSETEKIAALGKVVSSVAHEINTPVGVSITTASYLTNQIHLMKSSLGENKISKKIIFDHLDNMDASTRLIEKSLSGATNLINQFKKLSPYSNTNNTNVINLHDVLVHFEATNKKLLEEHKIQLNINCEEIMTKLSPNILIEIFDHLLNNAITHGFSNNQDGEITISIRKKNDHIKIKFANNGNQIDESDLEHIFEPFFTTAHNEINKGLGLNIVHGIVTNVLDGDIAVRSLPEEVEFLIDIPIGSEIQPV